MVDLGGNGTPTFRLATVHVKSTLDVLKDALAFGICFRTAAGAAAQVVFKTRETTYGSNKSLVLGGLGLLDLIQIEDDHTHIL